MASYPRTASRKSPSLAIGPLLLPNPVFLAPMSGITDAPFRRLAAAQGAGLVISEMAACGALAEGKRGARLRAEGQSAGLHVIQLAGCEAHWMAEGARIAEGVGAAIVDINMGCPAKHVTSGQSGSALMRDLNHALTLIEAVVQAVKVPVTLKMRLGWDARSHNAPELAPEHLLKTHRQHVLTLTNPTVVQRRLLEAFDAFGGPSAAWRNAA